jgi:hypothetical protein
MRLPECGGQSPSSACAASAASKQEHVDAFGDRQRRELRNSSWHRQYRAADAVLFSPSIGRHRPFDAAMVRLLR